jgi:hypothetical protein
LDWKATRVARRREARSYRWSGRRGPHFGDFEWGRRLVDGLLLSVALRRTWGGGRGCLRQSDIGVSSRHSGGRASWSGNQGAEGVSRELEKFMW